MAVKHTCGFDAGFFKLLKKKFEEKKEYQKKGVLLLDEIFLRTSLNVGTRTLLYSGLEHFGGEIKNKIGSSELDDHGLVFMWSSLFKIVIDLAQLVVKAIVLLKDAGLQVIALTCDGALTNKTMINHLGINGKSLALKNHFINPYDYKRNVYVICDVSHIVKNIRNRLVQHGQLKVTIKI